MNVDTIEIPVQEQACLVNKLARLLEEQINVVRCSDMNSRQIESLSEETQALVKDIVEKGLLELEELRYQKEQIKRLYHSLNLAIIARRDEADRQLKQVRKGKKVVEVYRSNF